MVQVTDQPPVDRPPVDQPGHADHGQAGHGPGAGYPPHPGSGHDRRDRFTVVVERLWTHPAWFAPLAVLTCFAGFSALLLANDPTDGRPDPMGGCALKALTGFDCPGCGGTRAYWYLLHGNLPEAARHHIFAVFAAPFLVYLYVAWAGQRLFRLRIPQLRLQPRMVAWFAIGWAVFTVLRNLPWAPFTLLYV